LSTLKILYLFLWSFSVRYCRSFMVLQCRCLLH